VPEGGDGGVDGDVHYVAVEQDKDQSPEGSKANLADEGKSRCINLSVFENLCNYLWMFVHLSSGVEMKP
jgi:hypothetical protein